jgi:hypothetical protein
MDLNQEQQDNKAKIEAFCQLIGLDPKWPVAVGMTESSLGMNQKSPTGCRGVFQMSSIAMKDLLLAMETNDDDWNDIACGVLFLRLLLRRHKTIDAATARYCDPKDVHFYVPRVKAYMEEI